MLSDKQSLILCAVLAGGIFVAGILNMLDHVLVLIVLALVFVAVIANIIFTHSTTKKNKR